MWHWCCSGLLLGLERFELSTMLRVVRADYHLLPHANLGSSSCGGVLDASASALATHVHAEKGIVHVSERLSWVLVPRYGQQLVSAPCACMAGCKGHLLVVVLAWHGRTMCMGLPPGTAPVAFTFQSLSGALAVHATRSGWA